MPIRNDYLRIQQTEDATAVAIGATQRLVRLELWVRGQRRRGQLDAEDYAALIDEIYAERRELDAIRTELAQLRKGA